MAVNIKTKVAVEVAEIPIQNADGSPMLDENNNPVTATCFGPASKIWQVADATKRRKMVRRTREANGKLEAGFDNEIEDSIEFICAVVKRFNGLEYPDVHGDRETVRAIVSDPLLGYIRDQLENGSGGKLRNWENFMPASQTTVASTPASLAG